MVAKDVGSIRTVSRMRLSALLGGYTKTPCLGRSVSGMGLVDGILVTELLESSFCWKILSHSLFLFL